MGGNITALNSTFHDRDNGLEDSRTLAEAATVGVGCRYSGGAVIVARGKAEKPTLGRYLIEKELGKGASRIVHLGKDPKTGRAVAIKAAALPREFESEALQKVRTCFFREAEAASRLTHPNIVTLYDIGEEHDVAYIAMEFLKGHDLTSYTRPDNLLPLPKILSIVARVADALSYAHAMNVVHRDIKPANIMYEPEGDTVKVTDFGIAQFLDRSGDKTDTRSGTPCYMSPEQVAGQNVDGRSDLFSLGVTLYQLVSGRLPFEDVSRAHLMFKIANAPHGDVRVHDPNLPACVAACIDKALAKNRECRYESCVVMAGALRLCLASLAPALKPAAVPVRP